MKYFINNLLVAVVVLVAFSACQQIMVDGEGPNRPTGVAAHGDVSSVTVSWDDMGADTYKVYWQAGATASDQSPNFHEGITGTTYTVPSLNNGTGYAFVVTAIDATGESEPSVVVTATPLAAPAVPGALTASSRSTTIQVSWDPVSGATAYDLYWKAGTSVSVSTGTKVTGVTAPASIENLGANSDYALLLVARNANGTTSEGSVLQWKTALAPPTPGIPTFSNYGNTSYVFGWNAVAGATKYHVHITNGATESAVLQATSWQVQDESTTSYNATGLNNTKWYGFAVIAVNAYGESDLSVIQSVAPAPTLAYTTNFSWYWPLGADLINNTGQTQYFIFHASSDGSTGWVFVNMQTIADGSYYNDDFGAGGTSYYRVAHSDNSGAVNGFWSNVVQHP